MLVLSRRLHEKIVLPDSRTTLQIVSVKAGTVRLCFDAPAEVRIYREEILDAADRALMAGPPGKSAEARLRELSHVVNNRLNSGTIGMALLRRQLELGRFDDMKTTLDKLDHDLKVLRERVDTV